jgi:LysM repeat protein
VTGRHRAPIQRTAARNVTVAVTGLAILSVPASAVAVEAAPDEAFNLIAECETGGRNVMNYINDATHTASGPWQITNTTWRAYGGTEFAPTAMQATPAQQLVVARRIQAANPSWSDWDESRHCWGPRMPAAMRGEDVTEIDLAGSAPVAPAPVPEPTVAEPTGTLTYTVRSGDTLSRIAAATGHTTAELAGWNSLANPDVIMPGQVIQLGPTVTAVRTYTVQKGDELRKIAAENHTTVRALAQINHLADPDLIQPNQVLLVDADGTNNLLGALPKVP